MTNLPLIIGYGGINAAGRSSGYQSYKRIVIDTLSDVDVESTIVDLASLMQLVRYVDGKWLTADNQTINRQQIATQYKNEVLAGTLVRKLTKDLSHSNYKNLVHASAQLPTGFAPDKLYNSRNHPRSLQLAVYGASDALGNSGIDLELVKQLVAPNKIGVFASNSLSSVDKYSLGGLFHGYIGDGRVSAKQLPLAYAQMPADFINAYLLGSLGVTGAQMGACATFLYNLRQGSEAIKSGQCKLAIVGTADAPILPEIIEGFRTIGALVEDKDLVALNPEAAEIDYSRASRPFGENAGFVLAEAAQFVVLASDDLALGLGAHIYGAVGDIFINADGYKTSITSPGLGNYLTVAEACSSVYRTFGADSLSSRSMVHAHGSSTPQNRVTESHILNEVAKTFNINSWPVASVKSYLGHSQGTASGDQLITALGTWKYGTIPGINSIDKIADDVERTNLNIGKPHQQVDPEQLDTSILNAKGFGGNNASAVIVAPHKAKQLLQDKYSKEDLARYADKQTNTCEKIQKYSQEITEGIAKPLYHFNKESVLTYDDIQLNKDGISIKGWHKKIEF